MRIQLLIALFIIGCYCVGCHEIIRRQASTEAPDLDESRSTDDECELEDEEDVEDVEDDEDCQVSDRALLAAEYFPGTISRDRALKMLKRAVELIEKPASRSKKPCRRDADIDCDAKNALRFLTGDPTIGSTTEEESQASSQQTEEEYRPEEFVVENGRKIKDQTIRNIMRLHSEGMSEKSIRSQYKWFRRQYIPRMQQFINGGGSHRSHYDNINEYVLKKIDEGLVKLLAIHDYTILEWGKDRADEIGADNFRGSQRWLTNIKKRSGLSVRKVTDLASRCDRAQQPQIEASKSAFAENYRSVSQFFPHHRILNVDQSGHKYEISNLRSLARRGSRDHVLAIDSVNKNTHSYTIQPIIGRDGHLRGKLLICFREPANQFGTRVAQRVADLETELGNVIAVASQSGKMSRHLTERWINEVLTPEIPHLTSADQESTSSQSSQETDRPGPSWASNSPDTWTPEQQRIMELRKSSDSNRRPGVMLLMDSWGGHSSDSLADELLERNIFVLRIPPRTTADLQPLDVELFRQYKIFIKRVMEASSYEGTLQERTDRYGIMRMHSVIWNQFQARPYRDLLLWAWRKTDPDFEHDEMENSPPPKRVLKIQFDFDRKHRCGVPDCGTRAFVRCAHCGKHLCLKHFLARECFHHEDDDTVDNMDQTFVERQSRRDDDDEGSAGAAAIVTGAAIGASSVAVGVGVSSGTSISAAGTAAGSVIKDALTVNKKKEETIPLLDVTNRGYLESVEVRTGETSMKDLIRD